MIEFIRQGDDGEEIVVDNFAGGGGASDGIRDAVGRPVDIAINHSVEALAMHAANHPQTVHLCESIWEVDPKVVCGRRKVKFAWFSPDCTHFSKAKGGQPRSKDVRGLADVVIRWAKAVKPRVIVVENVEEFLTWGPLDENGDPIKERAGEDFDRWFRELTGCGYSVDYRILVAADYGAPTTRRRIVIVARCDGRPVVWPEPTHGKGRANPWRTAAEIINWSLPCPSIFGRKKPLAPATMRRIAAGLKRYVIDNPQPFIIPVKSWGGGGNGPRSIHEPMRTVTTSKRGEFALVAPYLTRTDMQSNGRLRGLTGIEEPVKTVTSGGGIALVTPFIAGVSHGDFARGAGARVRGLDQPHATVTGSNDHALIVPTLIQTGYGERDGQAPRVPGLDKPLGTVVAGGQKHALVAAFLAKHYTQPSGKPHPGIGCDVPLSTVTTADHHSLVNVSLESVEDHGDEVRAFLVKYYGSSGHPETQKSPMTEPLDTVTTRDRFGLVTVHGHEYVITDVGMRMLQPEELFGAQGFRKNYIIDVVCGGRRLTKTTQIELAGNSVCPPKARAVVAANLYERWEMTG